MISLNVSATSTFQHQSNMPLEWFFLPRSSNQSNFCIAAFEDEIKKQGLRIIGWRDVPVDTSSIGEIAAKSEPKIKQLFVDKNDQELSDLAFNAKLFAARKIAEHIISKSKLSQSDYISIYQVFQPQHLFTKDF